MMIALLLATYNSGKYLREQLDSLFLQTYKDWTLYVHDDGSIDDTLDIVKEYSDKYPNRIFVVAPELKGLGAYMNFVTIMNAVEADYYAFCDHDDVWLPNKLEISVERMQLEEQKYPNLPIVVNTDMMVVDQNLNVLNESFWNYSRLLPNHIKFEELVSCNSVNGCTMLFNNNAKQVTHGNEPYCLMHDTLVSQSVAIAGGIISVIKKPTMLYRQHLNNEIGAPKRTKLYFVKNLFNISSALNRNFIVWKRIRNMKNISFLTFLYYKFKVTLLRYMLV